MKKTIVFWIYFLGLHILLVFVIWKSDFIQRVGLHLGVVQTWPHYRAMVGYHAAQDAQVPAGSVVFLGDSITQGLLVSEVTPVGVNYGIGGDNVEGVINRIPRYSSLSKASGIVLAIGVNDLSWRDDDRILADYARLLQALPRGPRVLVCAILPVAQPTEAIRLPDAERRIPALNDRLRKLAAAHQAAFVDAGPALSDDRGRLGNAFHGGDGIHLNAAGYAVWAKALREALASSN